MTHGGQMTPEPGSEYSTPTEGEKPAVPPSHAHVRKTVEAYLTHHPDERKTLAGLLSALDQPDDATSRTALPGHVTRSTVVIDRNPHVLNIRRHAAEHPPEARPNEAAPAWDGGRRTVLNGIGVHLHLEDEDGRVLLGLRHPGVAYAGNTWHFLAGKCERESAVTCLVREAREEAGLVIDPQDVELVHVVHVVDTPGGQPLMQMVFRARRWEGVPELLEPDKCLAWQWWEPTDLPERLVPYTRAAIEGIMAGRSYTELGWKR
ncbi:MULTISPECIES: NUDIX domain-containing protein [unclassified Streptomyces]|uniref:NUDIX domain-containing protein n=1 Tax=unclassified Streptomyces TaxID=2593676 RepID=UPI002B1E3B44|nr:MULTISPECIES: NUDIX domain-containing protein [unclassified Streptomyces]